MNKYLTLIIMLFCMGYYAAAYAEDTETKGKPASHGVDSTKILLSKSKPAVASVITKDCFTTEEYAYSMSAVHPKSAYPKCPENTVVLKTNFRTKQFFADVYTYISFVCCKQETSWSKKA